MNLRTMKSEGIFFVSLVRDRMFFSNCSLSAMSSICSLSAMLLALTLILQMIYDFPLEIQLETQL